MPYFAALALGVILFLASGAQQGNVVSDGLFALASGALIVGLVRTLGNLKMFASLSWGTRLLRRVFVNRARSGREESEDYAAYRRKSGGHADAPALLIASAVLMILSFAAARLP